MEPTQLPTHDVLNPVFTPILDEETNVHTVPRDLDASMVSRLQALAATVDFAHETPLDLTDLDVSPLLVSIPNDADRDWLKSDIEMLAQQLGALLDCKHVHAHLYTQRMDACRKIHTDRVSLRILCTYAGEGTDWLPNEDLVREQLGASQLDADEANRRVIRPGASLRRAAEGEVLLLKGEAYDGNANGGVAHRSPPIESMGGSRLVLKIDQEKCGC